MELREIAGATSDLVTAAALITGGVWAYIKFARGRTFAYRAELSVSSELKYFGDHRGLLITLNLKNTGLSKIPFNKDMKVVRIFGLSYQSGDTGSPEWERILTIPCFMEHDWVEAEENIEDELLHLIPTKNPGAGQYDAYRIEVVVGAKPRWISRKRTRWHARKIFVAGVNMAFQARYDKEEEKRLRQELHEDEGKRQKQYSKDDEEKIKKELKEEDK